jgi:hypothetical protein
MFLYLIGYFAYLNSLSILHCIYICECSQESVQFYVTVFILLWKFMTIFCTFTRILILKIHPLYLAYSPQD